MLWNNIPSQLSKENKKFIYGLIKEGARARSFEIAMMWLSDCGLIYKLSRVSKPRLPLKSYEDLKAFKLFVLDVGLLSCMVRLDQSVLLDGNRLFSEFKGALTEQYVMQQLKTIKKIDSYYWTNDRGSAEVDFIIDTGTEVVPVEVKASTNLQAKSLKTYYDKYHPTNSIRTSMADYKKESWLLNLPLWAVEQIVSE
jgi:predicted AAA+ superfamily ATPase